MIADYIILQWIAFLVGVGVYLLVMVDVFVTTVSMHGGGPVTNLLMRQAHRLLSAPPNATDEEVEHNYSVLAFFARYSNLVLTLSLFVMWITLLIIGLTLMLCIQDGALAGAKLEGAASIWERLYFAGASITTAGFGDYTPGTTFWQQYTVLMALSGLVVSSLGVSYVINIAGAVIQQRSTARSIHNRGSTVRAMLAAGWTGKDFSGLDAGLDSLSAALVLHTENHLAYPMVHYVRTDDQRDSLPSNIAVLDEALSVLLVDVPREYQPSPTSLVTARRAVTAYLESVEEIYFNAEEDNAGDLADLPLWPDTTFLATDWNIPPGRGLEELSETELEGLNHRRRLLRASVQSQGRSWQTSVVERKQAENGLDLNLYASAYPVPPRAQLELANQDANTDSEHKLNDE